MLSFSKINADPGIPRSDTQKAIGRSINLILLSLLLGLVFSIIAFALKNGIKAVFSETTLEGLASELGYAFIIGTILAVTLGVREMADRERTFRDLREYMKAELDRLQKEFTGIKNDVVSGVALSEGCRRMGLTKVYQRREEAARDIINDIEKSKSSCRFYVGMYFPELFDTSAASLANALAEGIVRSMRDSAAKGEESAPYLLQFTCLDWSENGPKDLIELWRKRERTEGEEMSISYRFFDRVTRDTWGALARRNYPSRNGKPDTLQGSSPLQIQYCVFKDYPCPRAMCIVDSEIVYLGLYEWEHEHGTENPALRLSVSSDANEGLWAKVFLSEADKIDRTYSSKSDRQPQPPRADWK